MIRIGPEDASGGHEDELPKRNGMPPASKRYRDCKGKIVAESFTWKCKPVTSY